jgi:hypothetical protein
MADILDDLEGILGADAITKLRANPALTTRLTRAEEVREFYDGEVETPPAAPPRREAPPVRPPTGGGETLADVMAGLKTVTDRIGTIDKTVTDKVNEVVQARGSELLNNAIAISMRNTRELTKLDSRHRADFNEDLDDSKLEAHVKAATEAGRPFRTITEAYDDMTREARVKKQVDTGVETGVREALKARASGQVPGVTPQSGSPMLKLLRKGPSTPGADGGTHLDKAARALEERLSERGESVA